MRVATGAPYHRMLARHVQVGHHTIRGSWHAPPPPSLKTAPGGQATSKTTCVLGCPQAGRYRAIRSAASYSRRSIGSGTYVATPANRHRAFARRISRGVL